MQNSHSKGEDMDIVNSEAPERREHEINDDDDYIIMLKKTGCYAEHLSLQDCYYDNRDWRKCKKEMEIFKRCMNLKTVKKEQ